MSDILSVQEMDEIAEQCEELLSFVQSKGWSIGLTIAVLEVASQVILDNLQDMEKGPVDGDYIN